MYTYQAEYEITSRRATFLFTRSVTSIQRPLQLLHQYVIFNLLTVVEGNYQAGAFPANLLQLCYRMRRCSVIDYFYSEPEKKPEAMYLLHMKSIFLTRWANLVRRTGLESKATMMRSAMKLDGIAVTERESYEM